MTVVIVPVVTVVIVTYFSKNKLTPRQPMRCSQGSFSRYSRCFVIVLVHETFEFCHNMGFFLILVLEFCLHFSFLVLSQFNCLSFLIVWVFYFFLFFYVELLSFATIEVFVSVFSQLGFSVLSQFELYENLILYCIFLYSFFFKYFCCVKTNVWGEKNFCITKNKIKYIELILLT